MSAILDNAPYYAAELAELGTGFPFTKAVAGTAAAGVVGTYLYGKGKQWLYDEATKLAAQVGSSLKNKVFSSKKGTKRPRLLSDLSDSEMTEEVEEKNGRWLKKRGILRRRARVFFFETLGPHEIIFSKNYINI